MLVGQFRIEQLTNKEDAERIVHFLLSDYSFDDTRYTPGELAQFRQIPYRALNGELILWYVEDENGQLVGINCIAENEQQTGGYNWDYLVVHQHFRKTGAAATMIEEMFSYLAQKQARYIVTYTCDLPIYARIRQLFERNGFLLVGRCPDYYYDGEDRLIYYRKLG